jgi:ankyrin repeat protein
VVCIQWGKTALMGASKYGQAATVQALIGAGGDLNLQDTVVTD